MATKKHRLQGSETCRVQFRFGRKLPGHAATFTAGLLAYGPEAASSSSSLPRDYSGLVPFRRQGFGMLVNVTPVEGKVGVPNHAIDSATRSRLSG